MRCQSKGVKGMANLYGANGVEAEEAERKDYPMTQSERPDPLAGFPPDPRHEAEMLIGATIYLPNQARGC
jgi:hypothetical protein